eukprot:Hpha_TRINITY_DN15246_c0_g1::TRINITY_DN15246_c0_g1_i1::g.65681::m.65681
MQGRSLLLAAVLHVGGVAAHRPILTKPSCAADFSSSAAALELPMPEISWAFSTYFTCESRALWVKAKAWQANAQFYVGTGVPAIDRFAAARTRALIVGPELPALSEAEVAMLPDFVTSDPQYVKYGGKGYLHSAPEEQSTCAHLGGVMKGASSVKGGRCNFHEDFGNTDSWWILDADNNNLPVEGGDYYFAVWPTEPSATKVTIATGTWQENFFSPVQMVTPGCNIDLSDFHEKAGSKASCLPYGACPATSEVGCLAVGTPASSSVPPPLPSNPVLGMNCLEEPTDAEAPKLEMGCGGAECPRAAQAWEDLNVRMHMEMGVNWTGDPETDFVYSMMPHHQGAIDMCKLLVNNMTCAGWGVPDRLDGLVHLCKDVLFWQQKEIDVMASWLAARSLPAKRPCGMSHMGHTSHMDMMKGCGTAVSSASATAFIGASMRMHSAMGVHASCQHPVDFVRMMAPHHAGGIAMVEALQATLQAEGRVVGDPLLSELVANISRAQHSEIAWMYDWLAGRDVARIAPCAACADGSPAPPPARPCEDLLAQTMFCHGVSQTAWSDDKCLCEKMVQQHPCGTIVPMGSMGDLNVTKLCMRTCGMCPSRGPLFWGCDEHSMEYMGNGSMGAGSMAHGSMGHGSMAHGSTADGSTADGSTAGSMAGDMTGHVGHGDTHSPSHDHTTVSVGERDTHSPSPSDDSNNTLLWILLALGGGLVGVGALVIGAVFSRQNAAANSSFNRKLSPPPIPEAEMKALEAENAGYARF